MIYIHSHMHWRSQGGAGESHGPLGFLKFPITLLKKSQIRQKKFITSPP